MNPNPSTVDFTVNGTPTKFGRINADRSEAIESLARTKRSEMIRAMLDDQQIAGRERFALMRDAMVGDITVYDINSFLLTRLGAVAAVKQSLESIGVNKADADGVIACISLPDLTVLARILFGFLDPAATADDATAVPAPATAVAA